jgi:dihydrofolate reductase
MQTFIIAAQSLDGFIAKNKEQSSMSWNSKEDKMRFVELTKRAGVVVMGSATYETFLKPLKDRRTIVYSRSKKHYPGVEVTNEAPTDLIARLQNEGVKEIAICGGSQIYTLFMKSGLIESIYLTIEPIFFGSGISLFTEPINQKLSLVSCEKTEHNTLLLEYKVAK